MKCNQILFITLAVTFLFLNSILNAQPKGPGSTIISIRLGPSTGQDVLVLTNFPNTNFNGHPDYLATRWTALGEDYIARTYFEFDLSAIPPETNVINAKLSLFANPSPVNPQHSQLGGSNTSYLYRVQTPWDESTLTWNTQPEYSTLHNVTIPATNNPNQDFPNLDVTQLVKDMIAHPDESYGFRLVTNTEWFFWYRSMNFAPSTVADTSKRPLLVITLDEPLPVELSSFSYVVNGRIVNLNWSTTTEQNNSGFEIQRLSLNSNTDWKKIGFVNGNGNTNAPNDYIYEDKNLTSGRFQYRIKQIDYNGNFKYYDLSGEVTIGIPTKFSLSQNYPNPFNPNTKISYDIPQDGKVVLKVYDISGREIKTLVNEFKNAGYYTHDFIASNLSSGAYFYKLELGESSLTKNMILIK